METEATPDAAAMHSAFLKYERGVRVRNYKVGCALAFLFMPLGASLDYFVYPDRVPQFFKLRIVCSLLLGGIFGLLHFRPHIRIYRVLGSLVALLPLFFISWMIYDTEGAQSPYYAGLNLVMLGAAILLRWTLLDSIMIFATCGAVYLAACRLHGPLPHGG